MLLTKILDDANIKSKLLGLFSAVAIGILVMAIAFWYDKNISDQSAQRSEAFVEYANLVSQAQTSYLKLRRYEADFSLSTSAATGQTYNDAPLDNHKKYMGQLEAAMAKLFALAPTIDEYAAIVIVDQENADTENYVQELVNQSSTVVQDYKTSFQDIVKFKRIVGFQDSEGLRARSFQYGAALEDNIQLLGDSALALHWQTMRENQKSIIQSVDLTEAYENLKTSGNAFLDRLQRVNATPADKSTTYNNLNQYLEIIGSIVANKRLANEYTEFFDFMLGPLFDEMGQSANKRIEYNQRLLDQETQVLSMVFLATILGVAVLVSLILFLFGRSITKPIHSLSNTIHEVNEGNLEVRTQEGRLDELGQLSRAFDKLLDEKVAQLSNSEKENDVLNESIIALLRSVAQLARRDFTVNIPVTEDVTGAVADSINSLAKATAGALKEVRNTSLRVAKVSNEVRNQSALVTKETQKERMQAQTAMEELRIASNAMHKISTDAQQANTQADNALNNTQVALDTVNESVHGINTIRDTISETEKRIKRLGERSQEITGVVNLINSIAERTHILALNASMHAASAGEAGRGFAVVADEVQRLAENAREATREIGTLVNNIQVETTDTVAAMNNAITHVANGTELAQKAGDAMSKTQASTQELVEAVQVIAQSSISQAKSSDALLDRAQEIVDSTQQTDNHMKKQSANTELLGKYSKKLVQTVSVFKLPVDEKAAQPAKQADDSSTGEEFDMAANS